MEEFECENNKPTPRCHGFCLLVGSNGKFMKCKFLKIIKTHEGDRI